MEWTKQRLAELLPGLEAPALEVAGASRDGGVTSYTARVNQVKSVTGEVRVAGGSKGARLLGACVCKRAPRCTAGWLLHLGVAGRQAAARRLWWSATLGRCNTP